MIVLESATIVRALPMEFLFGFLLDFFYVEERGERKDKVWVWSARFPYRRIFRQTQKKSMIGTCWAR